MLCGAAMTLFGRPSPASQELCFIVPACPLNVGARMPVIVPACMEVCNFGGMNPTPNH